MSPRYTLEDLDPSIIVEPPQEAKKAVIWLHGLGADGHDFVGILPQLNLPKSHSVRFVFPHAPIQPVTINGGMTMRSWYDIYSMTIAEKMDLESIALSTSVLEALIQQQIDSGIKEEDIVIAGFSQGGLIALNTAAKGRFNLAGVMALSTYYPMVCFEQLKQDGMVPQPNLSVYLAHGHYDPVIPYSVAETTLSNLKQIGFDVAFHDYPMEHQVCMEEIETISHWLLRKFNLNG